MKLLNFHLLNPHLSTPDSSVLGMGAQGFCWHPHCQEKKRNEQRLACTTAFSAQIASSRREAFSCAHAAGCQIAQNLFETNISEMSRIAQFSCTLRFGGRFPKRGSDVRFCSTVRLGTVLGPRGIKTLQNTLDKFIQNAEEGSRQGK